MPVLLRGGKILRNDTDGITGGEIFLCESEDVGTSSCCPITIFSCDQCPKPEGMSKCWEVAVAGVTTADDCLFGQCDLFNRTFVMVHVVGSTVSDCFYEVRIAVDPERSSECQWGTALIISMVYFVPFPFTGPFVWRLQLNCTTELATYHLGPTGTGSFDCQGPNIFELTDVTNSPPRCNYPSTLTVEPIVCPS
jgi:hypothetical protein